MKKKQDHLLVKDKINYQKGKISNKIFFSKLKTSYTYLDVFEVMRDTSEGKFKGKNFVFNIPHHYEELRKIDLLYFHKDIKKELKWNFIQFEIFAENISEFCGLKNDFENYFIVGDYDLAKEIVDIIDEKFGVSLWSLESRFVLEEYSQGLEKNKELLDKINQKNCDFIISWLADFYSYKSEKNTSINQYLNKINKFVEGINNEMLRMYLTFKLTYVMDFSVEDMNLILFVESKSSIIDKYLSTIKICKIILTSNEKEIYDKFILNSFKKISSQINDPSIKNILSFIEPRKENINSSHILMEICDLYTKGDYRNSINLISEELKESCNQFELYELYIKCLLHLSEDLNNVEKIPTDSIQFGIIRSLFHIFSRDKHTLESKSWLMKIAYYFNNSALGIKIADFINKEFTYNYNIKIEFISELSSHFQTPKFSVIFMDVNLKSDYLFLLSGVYPESKTLELFLNFFNKSSGDIMRIDKVPHYRLQRYQALQFKNSKKNQDCIEIYEGLSLESKLLTTSAANLLFEKNQTDLYYLHIEMSEYNKAINLYVKNYIKNKYMVLRMDLKILIDILSSDYSKRDSNNIALPIAFHIFYQNQYNKVFEVFADFLDSSMSDKPSQLDKNQYNEEMLVYFLKNICTLEILDSLIYDYEEEVYEERINIIQSLLRIDQKNETEYVKEISKIKQKLLINKMTQVLDESRIDINVEGIKNDPGSFYKENYRRYLELSKLLKPYQGIDLISDLINIRSFRKISERDLEQFDKLKRSYSELSNVKYILFKEALFNIRDQFIFNTKYGLDSKISTRIRHGYLLNEMRAPFQTYNLILTKKDASSERYDFDEFWINKTDINDEFKEKLKMNFEVFSANVDQLIRKINQEWLKIKVEKLNPNALFDYTLDEITVITIYEDFEKSNIKDSEEFFNLIMLYLWSRTEVVLRDVREKIKINVKNEIINILEDLILEINQIKQRDYKHEKLYNELFIKLTNCRIEVLNQLDKISEWFKVSTNKENVLFDANLLVDTFIETFNTLDPIYKSISINRKVKSDSQFLGHTFPALIDIIKNLFDNAIQHSKVNEYSELEIELEIFEDDTSIKLWMSNSLALTLKKEEIEEKINKTLRKIQDPVYMKSYVAKEGGSGYVKIVNILDNIDVSPYEIELSVSDDNKFQVMILFNKQPIVYPIEEVAEFENIIN